MYGRVCRISPSVCMYYVLGDVFGRKKEEKNVWKWLGKKEREREIRKCGGKEVKRKSRKKYKRNKYMSTRKNGREKK